MSWLPYVAYLFGGIFLFNAIPHLVAGLMGRAFQTPFATPPGRGLSSSTVNLLWGFANLVAFYLLVCHVGRFDLRDFADVAALGLGMLLLGIAMARRFGELHGGNHPERGHPERGHPERGHPERGA